jgi:maleate isomerase
MNKITNHRIGLIVPSVNTRMEPEFYRVADIRDVNYYTARVFMTNPTEEILIAMEKDLRRAATMISSVLPEAVVYGCTSGSFIKGEIWDNQIIAQIEEICHCPAVTTSRAMLNAIQELGLKKITLVTPYTDDINEKEVAFFEHNRIRVVAMKGLQIADIETLRTRTQEEMRQLVLSTDVAESEGVFISCTAVEGTSVCQELEDRLGKPVLSSNLVSLWNVLRLIGYHKWVEGYGILLRKHL